MKNKILYFIPIILLLMFLLPSSVLGAVVYERTPELFETYNPVSLYFHADNYAEMKTYCNDYDFEWWEIVYIKIPSGSYYTGLTASSTQDKTFVEEMDLGEYQAVQLKCYIDYENPREGDTININLEMEGSQIAIFEVKEYGIIGKSLYYLSKTTAIASTTAYIGDLFNSFGGYIWLIIGIPLGFWILVEVLVLTASKGDKKAVKVMRDSHRKRSQREVKTWLKAERENEKRETKRWEKANRY